MHPKTQAKIHEVTQACLDNTMNFPSAVQALLGVEVSHYRVDYIRNEKAVYLRNGESIVETLDLSHEPIGPAFEAEEVCAAIKSSQTEGQPFRTFVDRTKKAGCIGYTAYLDGQKVVYNGRLGEEHVELFPA
ncbi:MAG: DUF1398 family protein [Armatimonadetes bacterium]|nr:DUF1398 family protein [Armatimonadota bacterium]